MSKTITGDPISGSLTAPASKSYAQRAIVAAMLARGETILSGITLCDDTQNVLDIARAFGCDVKLHNTHIAISSPGVAGLKASNIDVGESGLAARLVTSIAALGKESVTITGHGSLLKRPSPVIEETLSSLGVEITTNHGLLPFRVKGPMKGADLAFNSSSGSQFLSGLLMALPTIDGNSTLHVEDLKSKPYIDMTIEVMRTFGVEVTHTNYQTFRIKGGQCYKPTCYAVEGDWSSASCLLVAGAVGGNVTISNLNSTSLQPDRELLEVISAAGASIESGATWCKVSAKNTLKAFEFDATHCPDLFPALVALAANCEGVSIVRGTTRLTHKESNRAQALADVFTRMGIKIDLSVHDQMRIEGGKVQSAEVSSHGDHRIAMAAAVAVAGSGCRLTITDAEAVEKSYPKFWEDLTRLLHP